MIRDSKFLSSKNYNCCLPRKQPPTFLYIYIYEDNYWGNRSYRKIWIISNYLTSTFWVKKCAAPPKYKRAEIIRVLYYTAWNRSDRNWTDWLTSDCLSRYTYWHIPLIPPSPSWTSYTAPVDLCLFKHMQIRQLKHNLKVQSWSANNMKVRSIYTWFFLTVNTLVFDTYRKRLILPTFALV